MDVHVAKDTEQGDPQDEEDQVPCPHEPEAQDEGHQVQDGREGGETTHYLSVNPFRVLIFAFLGGAVQVDAVEPADGDGEGELYDVDGGEDHIGDGHTKETHLDCLLERGAPGLRLCLFGGSVRTWCVRMVCSSD